MCVCVRACVRVCVCVCMCVCVCVCLFDVAVMCAILSGVIAARVSSRIFCLGGGGKNSLESLTTPTLVGTLYWHVINLFCTTLGY